MTRDEGERISLSDLNELDAEEIQAVPSPSSVPPPPPKEALSHVVVPRLAPLSSDSLRPPRIPDSAPEADPEMEITETPRRAPRTKKQDDEGDDRDVVDIRWVLAAAVLLAVVIGTWTLARRGEPRPAAPAADPERVALTLTGLPSGARVELDGRAVTGPEVMVRGGVRHAVEVQAEGHETWRQVFITRGGLELVVQLVPSTESATPPSAEGVPPPAAPPVAEAPPAPPVEEEAPVEVPPAAAAPSARPRTSEPSTMSASTSTSTMTTSTSTPMTATMRSTHTLVRDPGF